MEHVLPSPLGGRPLVGKRATQTLRTGVSPANPRRAFVSTFYTVEWRGRMYKLSSCDRNDHETIPGTPRRPHESQGLASRPQLWLADFPCSMLGDTEGSSPGGSAGIATRIYFAAAPGSDTVVLGPIVVSSRLRDQPASRKSGSREWWTESESELRRKATFPTRTIRRRTLRTHFGSTCRKIQSRPSIPEEQYPPGVTADDVLIVQEAIEKLRATGLKPTAYAVRKAAKMNNQKCRDILRWLKARGEGEHVEMRRERPRRYSRYQV